MTSPFINFKRKDYIIWGISIVIVVMSNILPGHFDVLTLIAALVGVTSLIFAAKGHVLAPILMVVFSVLYGIISYRFRYYGEMVTYLGMTLPMSVWATITWVRNQSGEHEGEVQVARLGVRGWAILIVVTALVTVGFYFILRYFETPNLIFSTLSVTTSFMAAALTMLRSSYYAAAYASNDVILIVLWVLASIKDATYIPVVVNFAIFLFNDLYGFISWKKREK